MDISNLIVGLLMIGIGFLIKSFPNLIAGYNTMSKDKKKNVDIEGLSTFMRNGLIAIGLTIIIGYYLFKWRFKSCTKTYNGSFFKRCSLWRS